MKVLHTARATSAAVTLSLFAALSIAPAAKQPGERNPLDVARVLALRYPAQPIMSYIPALSWAGALRLTQLTKDPQFADKARREFRSL